MQISNLISRIRGESRTAGLDIGHRLMKLAVIQHKQGFQGKLLAYGQELIPEGVIVDNEIKNKVVLAEKIQSLLLKTMPDGIESDFVVSLNWTCGILCDRILVKPVPKVPENELILQAAMARSPFDEPNNVLDYFIIDRKDEGIEAMIVAVKKDVVTAWVELFQTLNIKLASIDVDVFALNNVYNAISQDIEEDESTLLLNLGCTKSYLAFLHGSHFNAARSFAGCSIQELQEQISHALGITTDEAGNLLMGNSASEETKHTMDFVLEEIAVRIDNAIRYFSSSDNYRKASKMIVVGGSNIKDLIPYLADRLSLDIITLNPFKAVQVDTDRFKGINFKAIASTYSIALGLALRRF